MSNTLTNVMLHLNEHLNEESIHHLEEELRKIEGVVSADHRSGRPHIIMVVYDSQVTQATKLLRRFQSSGLHAQLIGM